jgi:hypothetical protein
VWKIIEPNSTVSSRLGPKRPSQEGPAQVRMVEEKIDKTPENMEKWFKQMSAVASFRCDKRHHLPTACGAAKFWPH